MDLDWEEKLMSLKWKDIEDIGLALYEEHPDVDPLSVRFTDLREWIVKLADWDDDIHHSNESKLEAIQMAWLEEYRENQ
jgi:FeS assembly protein IscX